MKPITEGTAVTFRLRIRDPETKEAFDPTTVKLKVKVDGNATATYQLSDATLAHPKTGTFEKLLTPGPGLVQWRWETTNANYAAQGHFTVVAKLAI